MAAILIVHRHPWAQLSVSPVPYTTALRRLWEKSAQGKVLEIPRGEVHPYASVAREIGSPKAVRTVGSALRRNPIPLLIPCYCVVQSNGSAGEDVFGSEAKRAVLAAEGIDAEDLERLARSGMRYFGSDTTRVHCFRTYRHARRISDRHDVPFSSVAKAAAAGYRSCRVYRPAQTSESGGDGGCTRLSIVPPRAGTLRPKARSDPDLRWSKWCRRHCVTPATERSLSAATS